MKLLRLLSGLILLLAVVAGNAHSQVRSDGVDQSAAIIVPNGGPGTGPCQVLWYGDQSIQEIARLTATTGAIITQTLNPADLAVANLSANYNLLVVAFTGPGVIGTRQADIQAYVVGGGGLLIHQPNIAGAIDYAPVGFGVTIQDAFWCNNGGNFNAAIINGGHPITSGLLDADLSGDFDLESSIGASYTVLARNTVCLDPALAVGTTGLGRIAYESGNASLNSFDPGSDAYWRKVFDWLCRAGATPTRPFTWGGVKAVYR
jgi:hypothetical protein